MKGLLAFCFLIIPLVSYSQELGPEELVKKITQDVLDTIKSDQQLAAGDKQKALKLAEEQVLPHVDFEEATRLAVGRSWSQAYEGQTLKVMPVRMKPGDTEVTVRNQYIRPGAKPVQLDYTMHKTDAGWKIYDIVVEGVSLVLTYRSEFDAVVKQEGIDGLIKRMAAKSSPTAGVGSTAK
jgi:phospholipid transport system substrate-binding protein